MRQRRFYRFPLSNQLQSAFHLFPAMPWATIDLASYRDEIERRLLQAHQSHPEILRNEESTFGEWENTNFASSMGTLDLLMVAALSFTTL